MTEGPHDEVGGFDNPFDPAIERDVVPETRTDLHQVSHVRVEGGLLCREAELEERLWDAEAALWRVRDLIEGKPPHGLLSVRRIRDAIDGREA